MVTRKLFLTTLIALASSVIANAQTKSVDIDNLRYSITYRSIPTEPLEPLFFTYSTVVNATKTTEQRISLYEVDDALYIAGQRKVNGDENPSLTIVLNLGNLVVNGSNINERAVEHKDRDGKVTSVSRYYTAVIDYTFEFSYKVTQGTKELLNTNSYIPRKSQHSSQEYSSRKEAADFWNNNKDVLISQFTTNMSIGVAKDISSGISPRYGFPVIKTTDIIKVTDEKKHLENETFKAACASLKAKFEALTPDEGLNKEDLEEIIEYFKSIPAKYTDPKSKADVRLRYAAYYNLCALYLYLDEPENVYQYADLIIQNDYDKKDGDKLKKAADELKKQLNRTIVKTRHFNPNSYFE